MTTTTVLQNQLSINDARKRLLIHLKCKAISIKWFCPTSMKLVVKKTVRIKLSPYSFCGAWAQCKRRKKKIIIIKINLFTASTVAAQCHPLITLVTGCANSALNRTTLDKNKIRLNNAKAMNLNKKKKKNKTINSEDIKNFTYKNYFQITKFKII
jgi:hypothetical protein